MGRFSTDIEVELVQSPTSRYFVREESSLGGALSRITDEVMMRLVLHGGVLGGGSYVILRDTRGGEMRITRGWFGRVTVSTTRDTQKDAFVRRFDLDVGRGTSFDDPYGNRARVRRIRHRDFRPFESAGRETT
ncbi:hypothetical protein A3C96_03810 [Candidatus Uhrbacteria bacterium RIFCSPHIGHO2_02_FULL_60_10]|uniref:Uncharacterized protein n=1 Tax=Candidatus Uhrbacteria bacterium RIFCSPHIGHO2_02_FULL_60_10 TaxID=1802392 RepID=A0A1F7U804_9BACT|nr:MAG: hypothetical protein A3C96_03810 [Candidatus Uhrbacteria bacterium RIFCSPHIGHO2_02_FULL_60_10]